MKFEDSPEVWVLLAAARRPRGDMIYKNDLGEPVLRATRLGGVTVFTDQRPGAGRPALAGAGAPLRLAPWGRRRCSSGWPRPAPGPAARPGGT